MSLIINLDPQTQRALELAFGRDLGRSALEALAAEGYRSGKLTHLQVQQLLGLADRWATEAWLKQHNVYADLTVQDVCRDLESSRTARENACSSSPTPRR